MEFKDVYTDFNDFYYYRLNDIVSSAKGGNSRYVEFLKEINENAIDLDKVLYKKLLDDYEETIINSKKFRLLPMGMRNCNVRGYFIRKGEITVAGRYGSLNAFKDIFLREANWKPLYYHSNDSLKQIFRRICDSYIEHYKKI